MEMETVYRYSAVVLCVTAVLLLVLFLILRIRNRNIDRNISKITNESYLLSDEWNAEYQKKKQQFPFKHVTGSLDPLLIKFSDSVREYKPWLYVWSVFNPSLSFLILFCFDVPVYLIIPVSAAVLVLTLLVFSLYRHGIDENPYSEFTAAFHPDRSSHLRLMWRYIWTVLAMVLSLPAVYYLEDVPVFLGVIMAAVTLYFVVKISLEYKSLLAGNSEKELAAESDTGIESSLFYEKIQDEFRDCKYIMGSRGFICFGSRYTILGNRTGLIVIQTDSIISMTRVTGIKKVYTKSDGKPESLLYTGKDQVFSVDVKFRLSDTEEHTKLPLAWLDSHDSISEEYVANLEFNDYEVEMIMEEFCRIRGLSYRDTLQKTETRSFEEVNVI